MKKQAAGCELCDAVHVSAGRDCRARVVTTAIVHTNAPDRLAKAGEA